MRSLLFHFLATFMMLIAPALADEPQWEQISDDDGIKTYRKEVPNSDIIAFRGEAVVEAPLAKVATVLIDTSRKKEWVAKIAEAKDIRKISELERIEYNRTFSGFFLVKDRDFVFNAKAEFDKPKKQMTIVLKSVEDPLMPESDKWVRGHLNRSAYTLNSIEDGKKTLVSVEIHADPKGSVPKWLVNVFQKAWPRKTLEGIRRQAAKPDVIEHASVKAMFESQPISAEAVSATKKTSAPVTQ